jgi:hypothetical protein
VGGELLVDLAGYAVEREGRLAEGTLKAGGGEPPILKLLCYKARRLHGWWARNQEEGSAATNSRMKV